jgi:hypothetical protein
MMRRLSLQRFWRSLSIVLSILISSGAAHAQVAFKQLPDKVQVELGGKLFTEYHHGADAPHVYFYPIVGPDGARMTRAYPMEKVEGEETDHPHHRGLWFAHGPVNGIDFWTEAASHGTKGPAHSLGKIVHDRIVSAEGGEQAGTLVAATRWVKPDGATLLNGTQTVTFYSTGPSERVFDFTIRCAPVDEAVTFQDSKEGAMAIRIAESMRLTLPKGKRGAGTIVNAEGIKDKDVWGKPSKWVAYSGPIQGKTYTIAILDHPGNLRHPTRWHARDYGLFAANPFCAYEMDKTTVKGSGAVTIPKDGALELKYRFVIMEGEPDGMELRWKAFAAGNKPNS